MRLSSDLLWEGWLDRPDLSLASERATPTREFERNSSRLSSACCSLALKNRESELLVVLPILDFSASYCFDLEVISVLLSISEC